MIPAILNYSEGFSVSSGNAELIDHLKLWSDDKSRLFYKAKLM
jgi:hypothetical protein